MIVCWQLFADNENRWTDCKFGSMATSFVQRMYGIETRGLRGENAFQSSGGKRGSLERFTEQREIDASIGDSTRLEAISFWETEGDQVSRGLFTIQLWSGQLD